MRSVILKGALLAAGFLALPAPAAAQGPEQGGPPPAPQAAPSPPPSPAPGEPPAAGPAPQEGAGPDADDPTRTAGGALAAFMSLRHYLTIQKLKAVMTPELEARYNHDSVPFNGKRGTRIAAFDFSETDLKPAGPGAKAMRASRTAATGGDAASAAPAPAAYVATARSLWEDQGEAVELRAESVRIQRREDGLWRVAGLQIVRSEPLRFKEAVPGVTALRIVLRAWTRRDPRAARSFMGPGLLRRFKGREEALDALFAGGADPRHVAYQILEMTPQGTTGVQAKVRLFEASPGRPGPLDGSVHTLTLVKKGPPWLLDAWD